jgi:hypothetical protein
MMTAALNSILAVGCLILGQGSAAATVQPPAQPQLLFPLLVEKEELEAGNPLAQYAAITELGEAYLTSEFAPMYAEIRLTLEEFLGFPRAGPQALALQDYSVAWTADQFPSGYEARSALDTIVQQARRTQIVIFAEEHHLPQTRSLFEPLLQSLWGQGYRYLAAETFTDEVCDPTIEYATYHSGFYTRDPVFASAVLTAKRLGYELVAYDAGQASGADDPSFRDRTGAANLQARIFERDPAARVLIIVGRLHASEIQADDGWTPLAYSLSQLTGINPFTAYAPTMTERSSPDQEHSWYRYATTHDSLGQPSIFVDSAAGDCLGFDACDAYIFWPRVTIENGRPDWLRAKLGRRQLPLPPELSSGNGLRAVQVFEVGQPASTVPLDQIVLQDAEPPPSLLLPPGRFAARLIDPQGNVLGQTTLNVE